MIRLMGLYIRNMFSQLISWNNIGGPRPRSMSMGWFLLTSKFGVLVIFILMILFPVLWQGETANHIIYAIAPALVPDPDITTSSHLREVGSVSREIKETFIIDFTVFKHNFKIEMAIFANPADFITYEKPGNFWSKLWGRNWGGWPSIAKFVTALYVCSHFFIFVINPVVAYIKSQTDVTRPRLIFQHKKLVLAWCTSLIFILVSVHLFIGFSDLFSTPLIRPFTGQNGLYEVMPGKNNWDKGARGETLSIEYILTILSRSWPFLFHIITYFYYVPMHIVFEKDTTGRTIVKNEERDYRLRSEWIQRWFTLLKLLIFGFVCSDNPANGLPEITQHIADLMNWPFEQQLRQKLNSDAFRAVKIWLQISPVYGYLKWQTIQITKFIKVAKLKKNSDFKKRSEFFFKNSEPVSEFFKDKNPNDFPITACEIVDIYHAPTLEDSKFYYVIEARRKSGIGFSEEEHIEILWVYKYYVQVHSGKLFDDKYGQVYTIAKYLYSRSKVSFQILLVSRRLPQLGLKESDLRKFCYMTKPPLPGVFDIRLYTEENFKHLGIPFIVSKIPRGITKITSLLDDKQFSETYFYCLYGIRSGKDRPLVLRSQDILNSGMPINTIEYMAEYSPNFGLHPNVRFLLKKYRDFVPLPGYMTMDTFWREETMTAPGFRPELLYLCDISETPEDFLPKMMCYDSKERGPWISLEDPVWANRKCKECYKYAIEKATSPDELNAIRSGRISLTGHRFPQIYKDPGRKEHYICPECPRNDLANDFFINIYNTIPPEEEIPYWQEKGFDWWF